MKQLAQHLRTGETIVLDLATPLVLPGTLLIRTHKSLVSKGTEQSLVEFSQTSLIGKALKQPQKTGILIEKIKSEGVFSALRQAFDKLDQLMPLGYCSVGEVIAVGGGVTGFQVGDLVASNGPHAEVIRVAANLAAKVPDGVPAEEAVFTVLGSVALQGIRLMAPALGEMVVVFGLGLVGQLTVSLLLRNGCKVIGIEPVQAKRELAAAKGIVTIDPNAVDCTRKVMALTGGIGADGVIIAASAPGNDVISAAAQMTRVRGKIVLVGSVGLHLNRSDFYRKEITFQVSCSYGPGRYDHLYEERNIDYPPGFVRWTENRNFQAILQLLQDKTLDVKPLISRTLPIESAAKVYKKTADGIFATLINYSVEPDKKTTHGIRKLHFRPTDVVIGIIGAGNFTRQTLLPNLETKSVKYIASAGSISSGQLSQKYRIPFAVTGHDEILADPEVDLVMITTRHDQHAQMVVESLRAGKHVFVEKPLALSETELAEIIDAYQVQPNARTLTIGFNRRFSPHVQAIKSLVAGEMVNIVMTVNAGSSENSWLDDPSVGGGRIIGEACHFIDLAAHIAGSLVRSVCMHQTNPEGGADLLLKFQNGSAAAIHYLTNGHRGHAKERIEVYSLGRTLILDDFKVLRGFGFRKFHRLVTKRSKGHREQFELLLERLKTGGEALIPFEEIVNTTRATLAALESFRNNAWAEVI